MRLACSTEKHSSPCCSRLWKLFSWQFSGSPRSPLAHKRKAKRATSGKFTFRHRCALVPKVSRARPPSVRSTGQLSMAVVWVVGRKTPVEWVTSGMGWRLGGSRGRAGGESHSLICSLSRFNRLVRPFAPYQRFI